METQIKEHVLNLLQGGMAHMTFSDAVAEFPEDQINTFPPNVEYTFWHLVEHLRITQWDILEYMKNPDYNELEWPKDYWPAKDAKATKEEWDTSVASFEKDLAEIIALINTHDVLTPVPSQKEHTFLREALMVADHNAYHIGELGSLRQVTKTWPKSHST